ncbi:hypothetical protein ACJX0J_011633, partial [Zea mays]
MRFEATPQGFLYIVETCIFVLMFIQVNKIIIYHQLSGQGTHLSRGYKLNAYYYYYYHQAHVAAAGPGVGTALLF